MDESRTVLVTGGAGYIGAHTVRVLIDAGWRPVVFDNFTTGHRAALPADLLVIEADLSDQQAVLGALERFEPWAVIHFAASIEAGVSMNEPLRFYRNNVANTLNLLDAMRTAGVRRVIYSSSAGVYGAPDMVPIPETAPLAPTTPYGATKAMVERILEDGFRAYGLSFVSLRYFNAAGAHPSGDIGEAHPAKTHLIELALLAALGKRPDITVYGADYPTRDGTAIRDYVHVMDLARAHVSALDALYRPGPPRVYNVGLGNGFSVFEVLDAVERVTGRTPGRTIGPRRPGDPPVLIADPRRIRRELGWRPRYLTLDEIVATAWRWHRTHPEDFGRRPIRARTRS